MVTHIDPDSLALLAASMERFRSERYGFEQRRAWLDEQHGFSPAIWQDYARMGWLALGLCANEDGFDGDPRPIARLMEYAGAALALEPLLASAVMSARLLARARGERARAWRADLSAGRSIVALAHDASIDGVAAGPVGCVIECDRISGDMPLVLHGDCADRLIVSGLDTTSGRLQIGVIERDASGVTVEPYRLIDGRGAARVALREAPVELLALDDGQALLEQVLDEARLAQCSETLGAVRTLIHLTLAHLKTRQQFGRSLAANQVLQHRLVELHMLQQELRAVIEMAWGAIGAEPSTRCAAVSAASAVAATAARQCAHEAVQMHGGMGITTELAVSHYFRRLMVCARLLGDRDHHLERFRRVGSDPARSRPVAGDDAVRAS
jgi:alkylation response protein AidB-like acyl-CoA dehydrogenase